VIHYRLRATVAGGSAPICLASMRPNLLCLGGVKPQPSNYRSVQLYQRAAVASLFEDAVKTVEA